MTEPTSAQAEAGHLRPGRAGARDRGVRGRQEGDRHRRARPARRARLHRLLRRLLGQHRPPDQGDPRRHPPRASRRTTACCRGASRASARRAGSSWTTSTSSSTSSRPRRASSTGSSSSGARRRGAPWGSSLAPFGVQPTSTLRSRGSARRAMRARCACTDVLLLEIRQQHGALGRADRRRQALRPRRGGAGGGRGEQKRGGGRRDEQPAGDAMAHGTLPSTGGNKTSPPWTRGTAARHSREPRRAASARPFGGGARGTRTPDLRAASATLSQLSYSPKPVLRGPVYKQFLVVSSRREAQVKACPGRRHRRSGRSSTRPCRGTTRRCRRPPRPCTSCARSRAACGGTSGCGPRPRRSRDWPTCTASAAAASRGRRSGRSAALDHRLEHRDPELDRRRGDLRLRDRSLLVRRQHDTNTSSCRGRKSLHVATPLTSPLA